MDDQVFVEQKSGKTAAKFLFDKFYDTPDCSSKFNKLAAAREKFLRTKADLSRDQAYLDRYTSQEYNHDKKEKDEYIAAQSAKINKLKTEIENFEKSFSFSDEEDEDVYETSFTLLTDRNKILEAERPIFVSSFDEAEEVISMNYPHLNIEFGDAKYFINRQPQDYYDREKTSSFNLFKFPYIHRVTESNVSEVAALAQKYGKVIVNDIDYRVNVRDFFNDSMEMIRQEPLIARRSKCHNFRAIYYSPENWDIVADRIKKNDEKNAKRAIRQKKMSEERCSLTSKGIKFWINMLISKYLCSVGMESEITVRYSTSFPYDRNKDKVKIHLEALLDHLEIVCKSIKTNTVKAFVDDKELSPSYMNRFNDGGLPTLRLFAKDPKTTFGNRKNAIRVFKIISKNIKVKVKK
jgi:hypothetical protein